MRKILVFLGLVAIAVLAAAGTAGGAGTAGRDRTALRVVEVPGGLSVRVPVGWHLLRGWLSDVPDPAPRLAVASFRVKLSHHTCECGFPNVVKFPRTGAFIFVWEYLEYPQQDLARTPTRPARFHINAGKVLKTCDGPSDTFAFKEAGRVFQVEVYVGPASTPALRAQLGKLLDSLRVFHSA